jgi:hypothetical protein
VVRGAARRRGWTGSGFSLGWMWTRSRRLMQMGAAWSWRYSIGGMAVAVAAAWWEEISGFGMPLRCGCGADAPERLGGAKRKNQVERSGG